MKMLTENKPSVFVFLGPTLSVDEAKKILPNACYLPPVRCGDILRSLRLNPKSIAIIDGYFERTAAVWHKEILLALAEDIPVYGASSMGALRAAELAVFGMKGIGNIFDFYHQGIINDDDEVTILHKNETQNFEPVTDAMVNIRATLESAVKNKIIDDSIKKIIENRAQNIFYQKRTLKKACEIAKGNTANAEEIEKLLEWSNNGGYVDQKKLDAITLLKQIAKSDLVETNEKAQAFQLSRTSCLRSLQRFTACQPFHIYREWLPIQEKTALMARLLGNHYSLAKRIARLMALVCNLAWDEYQLSTEDVPFGFQTKNFIQDLDCGKDKAQDYITRLKYINKLACFNLANPLTETAKNYILMFMKVSGDYEEYKTKFDVEKLSLLALEEKILYALKQDDPEKYTMLLYTAYLWTVIVKKVNEAELEPPEHDLSKFIVEFRNNKNLLSLESIMEWIQKNDLDRPGFINIMAEALTFDHIVKCNNTDGIGIFQENEKTWWLLDALYLTRLYPRAKRLLTDVKCREETIKGINKKMQEEGNKFAYSIDFEFGKEEFEAFKEHLQGI